MVCSFFCFYFVVVVVVVVVIVVLFLPYVSYISEFVSFPFCFCFCFCFVPFVGVVGMAYTESRLIRIWTGEGHVQALPMIYIFTMREKKQERERKKEKNERKEKKEVREKKKDVRRTNHSLPLNSSIHRCRIASSFFL
jgi:hypothetical protein